MKIFVVAANIIISRVAQSEDWFRIKTFIKNFSLDIFYISKPDSEIAFDGEEKIAESPFSKSSTLKFGNGPCCNFGFCGHDRYFF